MIPKNEWNKMVDNCGLGHSGSSEVLFLLVDEYLRKYGAKWFDPSSLDPNSPPNPQRQNYLSTGLLRAMEEKIKATQREIKSLINKHENTEVYTYPGHGMFKERKPYCRDCQTFVELEDCQHPHTLIYYSKDCGFRCRKCGTLVKPEERRAT